MTRVRFETSGWRAVIADELTFGDAGYLVTATAGCPPGTEAPDRLSCSATIRGFSPPASPRGLRGSFGLKASRPRWPRARFRPPSSHSKSAAAARPAPSTLPRATIRPSPRDQALDRRRRSRPSRSPTPPEPRSVDLAGGLDLLLDDGSWILLRESGTEPVARLDVEARSEKDLDALSEVGREPLEGVIA